MAQNTLQEQVRILAESILTERRKTNRNAFPTEDRIGVEHYDSRLKVVPINETNAKRMLARHSNDGYIVISPCRSNLAELGVADDDPQADVKAKQENQARVKEMERALRRAGVSYTPVYGGFIENLGDKDERNVYERSFMIYNRKKDGSPFGLENLYNFGINLAKYYNQDSFLFKEPDNPPRYITKDGEVDMEFGNDATFNDFSQEYFTDLHKNSEKHAGKKNGRPTRFTFMEAYVNPPCGSVSSRAPRSAKGEVFIY